MYRGRLRHNSGLPNGGNGVRQRWVDRLGKEHISSTSKDNSSDRPITSVGGGRSSVDDYQLELISPSTISNTSSRSPSRFRYSDKYSYSGAYEAVYNKKVVVHTVEDIANKDAVQPAPVGLLRSQQGGRSWWWWPWILIPLLLLLPLFLIGVSDNARGSLCAFFGPFPISTANRTSEIITLKKFYHFFVPTQVSSSPNHSSASTLEEMKKFETLLTAVDSRLGTMEDALKQINASDSGNKPTSAGNVTKDIHSLRVLFTNLDQRVVELESASTSSISNRKRINDEMSLIRSQLTRLQQNLATLEDERKSWREQLNEIVAKNRQQRVDLAEINSRLDSLSRSDCDCPPAVVPTPAGAVSRQEVDRLITEAIRRYDADKTGLPDYALEPAGATVLSTRCTETYPSNREHSIWGIRVPFWPRDYSPRTVIQPGLTPGECWAFKGAGGYLAIKLSGLIQVTAVSYEHIPKEISPDGNIFSAPKNMEVYALTSEMDHNGMLLGTFTYNTDGTPLQYFPVQVPNAAPTEFLELRVTSNHGHPLYTCLYRFRVHGKRLNAG